MTLPPELSIYEIFFLCGAAASFFSALFLFLERYSHLSVIRGVKSWVLSLVVLGSGFALLGFNRAMPWFLTVVPAHILLSLGGLFQVRAIAILLERKFPRRYFYGVWLLVLSVYSYFVLTDAEIALRIVLISNFYAFLAGSIGYLLLTDKHTPAKNRPYFFGGIYLLVALLLFIRSFYFIARLSQSDVPMFPGGGYAVLLLAGVFLVASFPTMGFIALCSQIYQVRFFARELIEDNRQQLQKALRENELVLGFALDSTVDAIWDFDLASKKPRFFRDWEKMLGYNAGELDGKELHWREILHGDEISDLKNLFAALIKGRTAQLEKTLRMKSKSGDFVWIKLRGLVVERDEDGMPQRLVGTLKNIDVDIRRIEEGRKNALLLDAVFESASVGLLVIHRSQKILKANRTIETLFALSMSADFVENLESLQFLSPVYPHEKQFAPPAAIARDVFESDKIGIVGFLLPHTLEERWLWMTTHYLEPMDAAVWFATDITELVEARDALQRMANELEDKVLLRTAELTQVNHELEAFSYSLSHDIRAPITRAQNWVRNLEKGYSDALGEKGRQMLAFIQAEMEHLEAMNAAMLRLAHASQTPLRISEVNLSGMAEELLSELRLENPTQSIQASIEHDLVVTADGELLRLLLRNLLENSVKFSQKKTLCHIHVGKEINGNDTTFFVSDNGEGFEMQYADKLFAPFQRLHSATEFPGLGVGLSIVLRIVHRHGGPYLGRNAERARHRVLLYIARRTSVISHRWQRYR